MNTHIKLLFAMLCFSLSLEQESYLVLRHGRGIKGGVNTHYVRKSKTSKSHAKQNMYVGETRINTPVAFFLFQFFFYYIFLVD